MAPAEAAALLLAARRGTATVRGQDIAPATLVLARAVQDATVAQLGPLAGWKVGASGPLAEPGCAPLPAAGLFASGVVLAGPAWRLRGVEVEIALRLGHDLDLDPHGPPPSPVLLAAAIDAVLPAIEVVETRLADWPDCDALAQVADLQCHGALVLGAPSAVPPALVDLRTLDASLAFNGGTVARTRGGNPAADVWRLLGWLALHCAQRGQPLRAGQVVTTGSCTGMQRAPQGTVVRGTLEGIGTVELQF